VSARREIPDQPDVPAAIRWLRADSEGKRRRYAAVARGGNEEVAERSRSDQASRSDVYFLSQRSCGNIEHATLRVGFRCKGRSRKANERARVFTFDRFSFERGNPAIQRNDEENDPAISRTMTRGHF